MLLIKTSSGMNQSIFTKVHIIFPLPSMISVSPLHSSFQSFLQLFNVLQMDIPAVQPLRQGQVHLVFLGAPRKKKVKNTRWKHCMPQKILHLLINAMNTYGTKLYQTTISEFQRLEVVTPKCQLPQNNHFRFRSVFRVTILDVAEA